MYDEAVAEDMMIRIGQLTIWCEGFVDVDVRKAVLEEIAASWNAVHMLAEAEETSVLELCNRLVDQAEHRTDVPVKNTILRVVGGPPEFHVALVSQLERLAPPMTVKEPENLVEAVLHEAQRCRELLRAYEDIGPAGGFGAVIIREGIARAERALGEGDVVELLEVYKELRGFE
jgi:hypothetical protein